VPPDQAHPLARNTVSRAIPPHRDRSRTVTVPGAGNPAPDRPGAAELPGHQITHSHTDFDESLDWQEEFNKQVNKIRYVVEQFIANF
jgi:hypothetical protein